MQPNFPLYVTRPNGEGQPPASTSNAVLAAYGMSSLALEYMGHTSQQRRSDCSRGRNWSSLEPPIHLYKYRPIIASDSESINRIRQMLVHGRIWVADPSSLNDLHDMRFKLELNTDPQIRRQWIKRNAHLLPKMSPARRIQEEQRLIRASLTKDVADYFTTDIEQNIGVFCASQDPRNEPMWAHYADDHRGICVQLDTSQDELFLLLNKVQYSSQFPTIRVPHLPNEATDHFVFKSSEWAYEREWRVVIPRNRFSIELRPPTVAGVILGARADQATRSAIEALNAERIELGHPAFKLYQAKQHKDRYGVRITKIESQLSAIEGQRPAPSPNP